jgi:predicted Zn-dependent protease
MIVSINTYTLQSTQLGMCEDLLADAGYDPDEHAGVVEAMAFAVDLAAVDTAYEVMREHGLKPLADQETVGRRERT